MDCWVQKRYWLSLPVLIASCFCWAIATPAQAKPVEVTIASSSARSGVEVPFQVCGVSQTWVRPTEAEQRKQLQSIPRFTSELKSEPLRSLSQQFWTNTIFSFTQYGLSLRLEPVYFSGLWTAQQTLWQCYDAPRISQINAGKRAEVWVLFHKVISVQWMGDRYVMRVRSTQRGFQFVQFPRKEHQRSLLIQVITETSRELKVIKGN